MRKSTEKSKNIELDGIRIEFSTYVKVRSYGDNIKKYIMNFIKELESKGKIELAEKIAKSKIEVDFTQESGTKRGGKLVSFNQTRTQSENQKGIKCIIINVKSKGNSNQFSVFKITFKGDSGNVLSDKDLDDLKRALDGIEKKVSEKVKNIVDESRANTRRIMEKPLDPQDDISTIAEASEKVQGHINNSSLNDSKQLVISGKSSIDGWEWLKLKMIKLH